MKFCSVTNLLNLEIFFYENVIFSSSIIGVSFFSDSTLDTDSDDSDWSPYESKLFIVLGEFPSSSIAAFSMPKTFNFF